MNKYIVITKYGNPQIMEADYIDEVCMYIREDNEIISITKIPEEVIL